MLKISDELLDIILMTRQISHLNTKVLTEKTMNEEMKKIQHVKLTMN